MVKPLTIRLAAMSGSKVQEPIIQKLYSTMEENGLER